MAVHREEAGMGVCGTRAEDRPLPAASAGATEREVSIVEAGWERGTGVALIVEAGQERGTGAAIRMHVADVRILEEKRKAGGRKLAVDVRILEEKRKAGGRKLGQIGWINVQRVSTNVVMI